MIADNLFAISSHNSPYLNKIDDGDEGLDQPFICE